MAAGADISIHPVKWVDEVLKLALQDDPERFTPVDLETEKSA